MVGIVGWVLLDRVIDAAVIDRGAGVVNYGGIWGMFSGAWWWTGAMLVGLMVIGRQAWQAESDRVWGWGILLSGGVSNLLDRVVYGGVIDYLYYPFLSVWGNIADILLGLGVGWLLWDQRFHSAKAQV